MCVWLEALGLEGLYQLYGILFINLYYVVIPLLTLQSQGPEHMHNTGLCSCLSASLAAQYYHRSSTLKTHVCTTEAMFAVIFSADCWLLYCSSLIRY